VACIISARQAPCWRDSRLRIRACLDPGRGKGVGLLGWGVAGRGGRGWLNRPFLASPLQFGLARKWLWWGRGRCAHSVGEARVRGWFGAAVGVCHEALLRDATALWLSLPQPRHRLEASGAGEAGTRSVPFSCLQQCSVRAHSPVGCAQMLDVPPLCSGKGSSAGLQDQQLKARQAKFMRVPRLFDGPPPLNQSFADVSQATSLTSR
jgi:hypothetical protein